MTHPEQMYRWRGLTDAQRADVLEQRKQANHPWHSPPHYESDSTTCYLLTAACYEHKHIIGRSTERMLAFEDELVGILNQWSDSVFAWIVLPNHYHALVDSKAVRTLLKQLGQLHGRTSFQWNGEDGKRGRKVWYNAAETGMKSEGHFYASLNYVLHNGIHHGYVKDWSDWPYCNASEYLSSVGREKAVATWRAYPLHDYGKEWDPPDL
ncbi:MAG: transposase [Aureliella sp.]